MNWEETIVEIRKNPEFSNLVRDAYFDENLAANVERYRTSSEFIEIINLIKQYNPSTKTIIDIGSGNGIAAVSFALAGYDVLAIEPDPSNTIGAGAIRELKATYNLHNLEVKEVFAENLVKEHKEFDIVFVRQALHHAYNLDQFVKSAADLLKRGGVFMGIREHVIFNEADKQIFLLSHPLHKFYGGENAFTLLQYQTAFGLAGLLPVKSFAHFESVINYAPFTKEAVEALKNKEINFYKNHLKTKIPWMGVHTFVWPLYKWLKKIDERKMPDDRKIAGRLHSFIYKKQ